MDNLKAAQSTIFLKPITSMYIYLLPANTTDLLQLMDIACKDFLKWKFEMRYFEEVTKQIHRKMYCLYLI